MIAQVPDPGSGWLTAIAALLLVVLGSGGVVAWRKVRPETSKITVEVAEGAVGILNDVLAGVRIELKHSNERIDQLAARLNGLTAELDASNRERDRLRVRVQDLETENAHLKEEIQALRQQLNGTSDG